MEPREKKQNQEPELTAQSELTQDELQVILKSFAEIYKSRNLLEREYNLVQKSKQYKGSFDEYRRMFEIYSEIQKQSHWTSYLRKIGQVLQAFGFIAIVFTAIKFTWDASDRQRKHLFENWDRVSQSTDASGKPFSIGRGRKEALEYLSDRHENLARLQAPKAVLSFVNLPNQAQLQEANFESSILYQAYLSEANLYNSNLKQSDLNSSNLKKANLRYANLEEADLQQACLLEANLEHVRFNENTNIDGADFRGVKNLDKSTVKKAKNYQTAIFDQTMSSSLGLPSKSPTKDVQGCQVTPRATNFWEKIFMK